MARDDGLMDRFDRRGERRFRARDGVIAVVVAALVLVAFEGASVRKAGEEMGPGVGRTLVLGVGHPTGWLSDHLGLAGVGHTLTTWISPGGGPGANSPGGFEGVASRTAAPGAGAPSGVPPVSPDAFDPASLGAKPPPRRPLHRLLVTGDSMSMPLDTDLARKLAGGAVKVTRDPHLGTGISKSLFVDWGQLSTSQVRRYHPDAIVVFIGANEGFSMKGSDGSEVSCCGVAWATIYASRVRRMMNTYRQRGAARVYWITLPFPRDRARQVVARTVNAAVGVAAQPWRDQVRLIDSVPIFTPGGRYRDAMVVAGSKQIVRQADGIHLNETGSNLLAGIVLRAVDRDFKR